MSFGVVNNSSSSSSNFSFYKRANCSIKQVDKKIGRNKLIGSECFGIIDSSSISIENSS